MDAVKIENLSFSYPGAAEPALDGVSLTVEKGEFFVLCGASGSGKSTLLRLVKPSLSPHGAREGRVLFFGTPVDDLPHRDESAKLGFVQQSPEAQIVTDKVWHELAFGLESLGLDTAAIRRRTAEMASFFGIETWYRRGTAELSGGQKQLLCLASVMAMQPEVLLLDEPTAQLDPIAAGEFLSMLGRINRELGTTIILTEHRLDDTLPLATRAAVLERGRVLCCGAPEQVGASLRECGSAMFAAMPTPMRVWASVPDGGDVSPITIKDGRLWLDKIASARDLMPLPAPKAAPEIGDELLSARELWFRYEKNSPDVVRGLSLSVRRGELLALMGGNGAGKTTALSLFAGMLTPQRGKIKRIAPIGLLPQDPKALFVKKTLLDDLLETAQNEEDLQHVCAICRLEGLLERHPYDLSGGEQQRAALAKVLLTKPQLLLLDEPTKGLDAGFKAELAAVLRELCEGGIGIITVSHDVEFCAEYATRCALFFDGAIVAQGAPREFFSGSSFYTTSANRMAREHEAQAVTAGDVIAICGGIVPPPPEPPEYKPPIQREPAPPADSPTKPSAHRRSHRSIIASCLVLLLIPITLYIGVRCFGDRKYYFISLVVLLECMAPFFLLFEGRSPRARELVLIATLCAIGIAGRAVFFMLPNCKPVLALTVISGVALGGETGFLVGSVTMLLSNMMFSQGPWTPWQMFAMGLCGFLAGVVFRPGGLARKRIPLCIFGAAAALLVYGGIMNPASAIMYQGGELNRSIIAAYYISGLPFDLVHAAATAVFLFFGAEPMLEKLSRVQIKYGMLE
jgi:energy-coupling factor transporter ATP-binding protein EcfA2/uncharacterized membrane protein